MIKTSSAKAYEHAQNLASTLQIRVSQTLELKLNYAKSFYKQRLISDKLS